MKNLADLKKRKEMLKKDISDIEEILSFESPKETLSAITNGFTDQFLLEKLDENGEQKLSIKPDKILSFATGGSSENFLKTKINQLSEEKLGINTQNIVESVTENALKLGIASYATHFAKKNLYHHNWKKKILGIALIYLAPIVLKFFRKKLEEFQRKETLKSMEKII